MGALIWVTVGAIAVARVGEADQRVALEDEILQGLAKGQNVRPLLERLAEIAPPAGRGVGTVPSQVTA